MEAFFIVWWSYGVFYVLYRLIKNYRKPRAFLWDTLAYYGTFLLVMLFIYARFIEPNMIRVKQETISTWFSSQWVLLSDLHLWVYKGTAYAERLVDRINSFHHIQGVLIPWDFTLVLDENEDFEALFAPLKRIQVPVYATLGNHDTRHPWPNIEKKLIQALQKNNVIVLDNTSQYTSKNDITLVWLWDNWDNNDKVEILKNFSSSQNIIVLAHNPDTTLRYEANSVADITVSGHTHGGQVRVPFLRKKLIPCQGPFISWYSQINGNNVYVTSGVGEVGLPLRFWVPPEIILLQTK